MPDAKDRAITVGAAVSVAGQLAAAAAPHGHDPFQYFDGIVDAVVEKAVQLQAQYAIADAMPGVQVVVPVGAAVQVPPQAPIQAVTPQQAPVIVPQAAPVVAAAPPAVAAPVAPAPIPGATDGDPERVQVWTRFFNDHNAGQVSSKWHNNIGNKRTAKSPDFKEKREGGDALWIDDKKNPSWVATNLRAAGYIA